MPRAHTPRAKDEAEFRGPPPAVRNSRYGSDVTNPQVLRREPEKGSQHYEFGLLQVGMLHDAARSAAVWKTTVAAK